MRTDYFSDLVAEFVTDVTAPERATVTPEKAAPTWKNNDLPQGVAAVTVVTAVTAKKHETEKKTETRKRLRHAYRFRLHNGGAGTFITDTPNLDEARTELVKTYGDRLALVVPT